MSISVTRGRRLLSGQILVILACVTGVPAQADLKQGIDAYDHEDYQTAFKELKPAAEQGVAEAQYRLAYLYLRGQGVEQNVLAARLWLDRAGRQNYPDASAKLAWLDQKLAGMYKELGLVGLAGGDGSSLDLAIRLVGIKDEGTGVSAEHTVTAAFFRGWRWRSQALVQGPGNRPYDGITLQQGDQSRVLYFDITEWFGETGG